MGSRRLAGLRIGMLGVALLVGSGGCGSIGPDPQDNGNNGNQLVNGNDAGVPAEDCADGLDNDGDGQVDCDDPDCDDDPDCPVRVDLTILQTVDLQNHAAGYATFSEHTPDGQGNDEVQGGYARLAAKIYEIRLANAAAGIPTLVVDAGDWSMGTAFDLAHHDPITLKLFTHLKYDAITLGCRDFDWGPDWTAQLIINAQGSTPPFDVPIIVSNLDLSALGLSALQPLQANGTILSRLVMRLQNGLVVGILGGNGPDSSEWCSTCDPSPYNEFGYWQPMVDDLRIRDQAELVVVLYHGAVTADPNVGDAVALADVVDGIDVIVFGHPREAPPQPLQVNDTLIVQPGAFGRHLSRLDLRFDQQQERILSHTHTLVPIDDGIVGDPVVQAWVDGLEQQVSAVLASAGIAAGCAEPIAETAFDLEWQPATEIALGNLSADALRAVSSVLVVSSDATAPFDVAMISTRMIGDEILAGRTGVVTAADAYAVLPFEVYSTGDSTRALPGTTVMSVYLTAAELYDLAKVTTVLAWQFDRPDALLHYAGMRFDCDQTTGAITAVWLCENALPLELGGEGDFFSERCGPDPLDPDDTSRLYRAVVDHYLLLELNLMAAVGLSILPKDAGGEPIDLMDPAAVVELRIDRDPVATPTTMEELKLWQALIWFLGGMTAPSSGDAISFLPDQDADGLGDIVSSVYGPGGSALGRIQ